MMWRRLAAAVLAAGGLGWGVIAILSRSQSAAPGVDFQPRVPVAPMRPEARESMGTPESRETTRGEHGETKADEAADFEQVIQRLRAAVKAGDRKAVATSQAELASVVHRDPAGSVRVLAAEVRVKVPPSVTEYLGAAIAEEAKNPGAGRVLAATLASMIADLPFDDPDLKVDAMKVLGLAMALRPAKEDFESLRALVATRKAGMDDVRVLVIRAIGLLEVATLSSVLWRIQGDREEAWEVRRESAVALLRLGDKGAVVELSAMYRQAKRPAEQASAVTGIALLPDYHEGFQIIRDLILTNEQGEGRTLYHGLCALRDAHYPNEGKKYIAFVIDQARAERSEHPSVAGYLYQSLVSADWRALRPDLCGNAELIKELLSVACSSPDSFLASAAAITWISIDPDLDHVADVLGSGKLLEPALQAALSRAGAPLEEPGNQNRADWYRERIAPILRRHVESKNVADVQAAIWGIRSACVVDLVEVLEQVRDDEDRDAFIRQLAKDAIGDLTRDLTRK